MSELFIQLLEVNKSFGANHVLSNVNLSIPRGQVTTIIGKSGVGKSVLLKHMIGLIQPDSGRILFEGSPLEGLKRRQRKALKKKFSYMFQGTALFDSMTVFENIALPLKEGTKLRDREIRKRVHARMEQLELKDLDDQYPAALSGGMKKRVALARALVTDPEIVLFDEPTTGLDPIRTSYVFNMISDYQKRFGFTGVIVSHAIPDVFYISQRVAFLSEGRIIFEGNPQEIQRTPDPDIRRFIHTQESTHEQPTELPSASLTENRFLEEMERLKRHRIDFSIGVFVIENLDELKTKADFISFQTIFTKFANFFNRSLRITDTSARYGLYEIMVILSHDSLEKAELFRDRMCEEIESKENYIIGIRPDPDISFSISLGFARPTLDTELGDLLALAESNRELLYEYHARPRPEEQ